MKPIAITLHYPKDGELSGDKTYTDPKLIKKVTEYRDNEFLLPDDLGWECNDELQTVVRRWIREIGWFMDKVPVEVLTAELIDEMYAVIKRYQNV